MSSDITIRSVDGLDEFSVIEGLQRAVWGMTTDTELVPTHLLLTAQHYGGVVLGAFTPDNEMIGFVFGFTGMADDKRFPEMDQQIVHCSHMMGVLPVYRGQMVGYRLKCAQREAVLQQNMRVVVWTYDPLLRVNATLNIVRLGGVCRTYLPNLYGELNEALNAGLPTDRFEVEWWIGSKYVAMHLDPTAEGKTLTGWRAAGGTTINQTVARSDGYRTPDGWETVTTSEPILVEIPSDFQKMRRDDLTLARAWRMHTREVFLWAFATGYSVEAFAVEDQRAYYVLTQAVDFHSLAGGTL